MSKKVKKPEFDYAATFDHAMNEAFEEEGFVTEWSLFAGICGGYVTRRENGEPLTDEHARVGRAISNALAKATGEAP